MGLAIGSFLVNSIGGLSPNIVPLKFSRLINPRKSDFLGSHGSCFPSTGALTIGLVGVQFAAELTFFGTDHIMPERLGARLVSLPIIILLKAFLGLSSPALYIFDLFGSLQRVRVRFNSQLSAEGSKTSAITASRKRRQKKAKTIWIYTKTWFPRDRSCHPMS